MATLRIDYNTHNSLYINSDKVTFMIGGENDCTFVLENGSKLKVSPWHVAFEKFIVNGESNVVEVKKLTWLGVNDE